MPDPASQIQPKWAIARSARTWIPVGQPVMLSAMHMHMALLGASPMTFWCSWDDTEAAAVHWNLSSRMAQVVCWLNCCCSTVLQSSGSPSYSWRGYPPHRRFEVDALGRGVPGRTLFFFFFGIIDRIQPHKTMAMDCGALLPAALHPRASPCSTLCTYIYLTSPVSSLSHESRQLFAPFLILPSRAHPRTA